MSKGTHRPTPLARVLETQRVLLCVGPGGVGKTTVSASLALRAALGQRKSLVCTIDPAKRLANALGLRELGNQEAQIPPEHLRAAGLPETTPLYATMLDMKQTWDEFIARHASPEERERILENRFYRSLSSVLAGSQEYIAMEKLWQLRRERDYPLVVLDTPPASHAVDFLEAPRRVLDFLDNDVAKLLLGPALAAGKVGLSLFKRGGFLFKNLSRFTGTETLQELAGFMLALTGLQESFRSRARQVESLLQDEGTSFVVVTSAAPERQQEAVELHRVLREAHLPVAAVVVNRVHARPPPLADTLSELPRDARARVEVTHHEALQLAERDALGITALAEACAPTPLVSVPQLPGDVHELSGLLATGRFLVGEGDG